MPIPKKTVKVLLSYFLDQYCVFYLKNMNVAVPGGPDGDELDVSAMVDGSVLDICCDYYYVGNADGEFVRVISHDAVNIVEIAGNAQDEMMDMSMTDGDVH